MAGPQYIPFVPSSKKFIDRSGLRYGRLVVIEPLRRVGSAVHYLYWRCQCDCGNEHIVVSQLLIKGDCRSCGCLRREVTIQRNFRHGGRDTRAYRCWRNMLARCDNKASADYPRWGGRGITYDPRWRDFANFFADMGDAPKGHTLDRRDNNGNYCKENCRWATIFQQANNTRSNHYVNFRGERLTLTQLAQRVGIPANNILQRLRLGWPLERAATEPVKPLGNGRVN